MRRDVFQAIADPTRRAIIEMLFKESLNLNAVADNFHTSRPAISRHIKILTECGLISIRQQGRERYCDVDLKPLQQVNKWIEPFGKLWTAKLNALSTHLEISAKASHKIKTTKEVQTKKSK